MFSVSLDGTTSTKQTVLNSEFLSFYVINATSLAKSNALQLLSLDVKQYYSHVVIVTETWFTSKHEDSCVAIDNYNLYRRDRVKRKGGGVCAYIRSDIKCEFMNNNNNNSHNDNIEVMWLKCHFKSNVYCVACCYHPPNPRYEPKLFVNELLDGVERFVNNVGNSADEYIILAGDFNTLDCDRLETYGGLVQIVNQPTHGDNILDKVFTNRPDCFTATVVKSLLKTKHMSVLASNSNSLNQFKPKRKKV